MRPVRNASMGAGGFRSLEQATRFRDGPRSWKLAERGGFEPPVQFYPYNGLANRRFRPLSHLSGSRHATKTIRASGKNAS